MATYAQMFVMRQSPELLARFVIAVEKAAYDITNEDPATPQHAQRIAFARRILMDDAGAQKWARRALCLAVVSNQALQDNGNAVTDSDVQFIVNSIIGLLPRTE